MTINKTFQNKEKGLSYSEKKKMFFFGFFIVLITGPRVFYSLPGNKKKKKDTIKFYFASLLFWVISISLILIIIAQFVS